MRQALGLGALGRPRGIGWRGRWESIGMGNTCKSMVDSFQCMTKPTTIKKIKRNKLKKRQWKKKIFKDESLSSITKKKRERTQIKIKKVRNESGEIRGITVIQK